MERSFVKVSTRMVWGAVAVVALLIGPGIWIVRRFEEPRGLHYETWAAHDVFDVHHAGTQTKDTSVTLHLSASESKALRHAYLYVYHGYHDRTSSDHPGSGRLTCQIAIKINGVEWDRLEWSSGDMQGTSALQFPGYEGGGGGIEPGSSKIYRGGNALQAGENDLVASASCDFKVAQTGDTQVTHDLGPLVMETSDMSQIATDLT